MKNKLLISIYIIFIILTVPILIKATESDEYQITDTYISRINPDTTVEDLKANLNSSDIKIYSDSTKSQEVTSGNLETNMCIEYEGKIRKISIKGDLNDDGKANQLDLTLMMRHILGFNDGQITDEMQKISADINEDNEINSIDITAIMRYTVYGEFEITANSPEITNIYTDILENSVKITALADEEEKGVYQYLYKTESEEEFTEVTKTKENSYTIDNLLENTKYTVMVKLTNEYGMSDTEEKEIMTMMSTDTTAPTITEVTSSSTTNSVSLTVNATDNESGVVENYKFYIKETSDSDSAYAQIKTGVQANVTKEGLKENTSYTIKVEVADNEGNKGNFTKEITTKSMPKIENGNQEVPGTIEQDVETIWTNGTAVVKLKTNTTHIIQYKINNTSEEWKSGNIVKNINNGDTVYARLWDGINVTGAVQIVIVEDKTVPEITEVASSTTRNSLAIQVDASDRETGLPAELNYIFYLKQTSQDDSTYEKVQEGSNCSLTKTELLQNTSYTIKVEIQDKVGNIGYYTKELTTKSIGEASADLESGNITATVPVWNEGKASITLSTNTKDTIEWQVNSVSGQWTQGTTLADLNHNDTVYARLTDGTNIGQEGSITIKDKTSPQDANISLSATTPVLGDELTATVTLSDKQTGIDIANCKWVYNTNSIEQLDDSMYTNTFSSETETISLSTATAEKHYLHILAMDKAGNIKKTVSPCIEVIQLITGITLNKTAATIDVGDKVSIIPSVTPTNATNKNVTWSSDNTDVATVDSMGIVTGVSTGTATITATAKDGSGIKTTCTITVTLYPTVEATLNEGDYVNYTDTNGDTLSCQVLYDSTSAYGTQIISNELVDSVIFGSNWGSSAYEDCRVNEIINWQNKVAENYMDINNTLDARSLGSVPNAKNTNGDTYTFNTEDSTSEYAGKYSGKVYGEDNNYETDVNQMNKLGITTNMRRTVLDCI